MGDGLFEIRAQGPEGIGRAFFCTLLGSRVVILHGFVKKTQATPAKELNLARARLREVKHAQR
jgi:phage-related protein